MTIQALKDQLKAPVIAAPMFLVSGTDLVIACSKAGILGTMPALNARTNEIFEQNLATIHEALKENGNDLPYGINLIVHPTNTRLEADLTICIKYKVPVIITSLGANQQVIDAVHAYGGLVLHDITNARHAQKAIGAGVDGLIAVSSGAGGHAGTINPFALMDELRSFYQGPIALAGCINTGKAVKAAITLSADFAYMGTRFIATEESLANQNYKDMLATSNALDITYTDAVSGVPANFLTKSLEHAKVAMQEKGTEDFSKLNQDEAKAWKDIWSAGQGVAGIHNTLPVAQLIEEIITEYHHC